jgi:pyruvate/2-oxoglutarate dehydrogenase complex dihydrolipoamide dehydrogenase (E3) component
MLFTHMAENMTKAAVMTALLKFRFPFDAGGLTWCTYTAPEIGQLGETKAELDARGASYEVHRFPYTLLDRALTDFDPRGQIKVFATRWRGKILGVSVVGKGAGDLLCEWAVARRNGLRMRHISDTIHPYPTLAWGNRRAADQWYMRRRPLGAIRWLRWLFGYRGEILDIGKDGTPV